MPYSCSQSGLLQEIFPKFQLQDFVTSTLVKATVVKIVHKVDFLYYTTFSILYFRKSILLVLSSSLANLKLKFSLNIRFLSSAVL